jgi:protein phosphatase
VVSDEAVHELLSTIDDADDAVNQLIELAIQNGGPDNITCIVADVVDSAAGSVRPSRDTQMVGAAANGDADSLLRAATTGAAVQQPSGKHLASQAAGAPSASVNGHRRRGLQPRDGYEDPDDDSAVARRRWPVVTSIFVLLVLLVVGGLFVGYRFTQNEYYLASDGGNLTIYRGVSQKIAWISLSSVYQRTGIPSSQVPAGLTLPTTPTTLATTQQTVLRIKHTTICKQAVQERSIWLLHKPKPVRTTIISKNGTRHVKTVVKPYRREPPLPVYCPALGYQ